MFKKGIQYIAEPYRPVVKNLVDGLINVFGPDLVSVGFMVAWLEMMLGEIAILIY